MLGSVHLATHAGNGSQDLRTVHHHANNDVRATPVCLVGAQSQQDSTGAVDEVLQKFFDIHYSNTVAIRITIN